MVKNNLIKKTRCVTHYGVTCLHCAMQNGQDPDENYRQLKNSIKFTPENGESHVSDFAVHLLDKGDKVGSFKCGLYDHPVSVSAQISAPICKTCRGHIMSNGTLKRDRYAFISDLALFSIDCEMLDKKCLLKDSFTSAGLTNVDCSLDWEIFSGDSLHFLFCQYQFIEELMYTYNERREDEADSAKILALSKIYHRDGSSSPAHLLCLGYDYEGVFSDKGDSGSSLFSCMQKIGCDSGSNSDEGDYSQLFGGAELEHSPKKVEDHTEIDSMSQLKALDSGVDLTECDSEPKLKKDHHVYLVMGVLSRNTSKPVKITYCSRNASKPKTSNLYLVFGFFLQPALDICVAQLFLQEARKMKDEMCSNRPDGVSASCIHELEYQIEKLTDSSEILAGSSLSIPGMLDLTYTVCLNDCGCSLSSQGDVIDTSTRYALLEPCFCS